MTGWFRSTKLPAIMGSVLSICIVALPACRDPSADNVARQSPADVPQAPPPVAQPTTEPSTPHSPTSPTPSIPLSTLPSQSSTPWDSQFAAILSGKENTLQLTDAPITATQLAQLAQLDGPLEHLLIDAGGVDDDSLLDVLSIKSLVHLRLRECPLGDAGFERLGASGLDHLRILNVPQSRVTSVGISHLASLPNLVQLRLGGAQLDDAAVAAMAQLPALRSLHLIGPRLTDSALQRLAQAPNLSSFYLDDCPLSDSAWSELFAAKPQLHVHIDQQHHDRDPHQH